jgi:NDP-hexose 4-ketoreductase
MTPRVLVLGAGGFLGQSFVDHVVERGGAELVLHDRGTIRTAAYEGALETHTLDLLTCPPLAIAEMVEHVRPDAVINCAGLIVGRPDELRAANLDLVVRLIDALAGRRGVRLVHLGSAAEYGIQRQPGRVSEGSAAAPDSVYGTVKLEATDRLLRAASQHGLSVTVLRLFNPVGRRSPAGTLPGNAGRQICAALRTGAKAINLGALDAWRDYIDVRDIARAMLAAAVTPLRPGLVLNVGRGEAVKCLDLVTALAAIAGYQGSIVESERRSDRSANVDFQCADISAITESLGWSPEYSIDDSLTDLWSGISTTRNFADV